MLRSFLVILFFASHLYGQNNVVNGIPYIHNFNSEQINANLKVWSVQQDELGLMYFGTPEGLYCFDGKRWNTQYFDGDPTVLSILSYQDKVFVGGNGVFGYWVITENGKSEFKELQRNDENGNFESFWRIYRKESNIYFQSLQHIFIYNLNDKQLKTIQAPSIFSFMYQSKGRLFVSDQRDGLFEISGESLIYLKGLESIASQIKGVIAQSSEELTVLTESEGVFNYKNGQLSKVKWPVNKNLIENSIFSYRSLDNGDFYVGTIRDGVYAIDRNGNVKLHLNRSNGIDNNTVLDLEVDNNGNLWLGLDGAICFIETNSPVSYILDLQEDFGSVYTSITVDSLLYLGTNQGLFVKNVNFSGSKSSLVEGSQGQVWKLQELDGTILMSHHRGAFKVKGRKIQEIKEENGTWSFVLSPQNENIAYSGFYFGINQYRKINGNWVFEKKLEGFNESARIMDFDKFGQLWVAHPSKGYYKIKLNKKNESIEKVDFYGDEKENVSPLAFFTKLDGNLLYFNDDGYFYYDPIEDAFVESNYYTQMFANLQSKPLSIIQYGDIFWYSLRDDVGHIYREGNRFYDVKLSMEKISGASMKDFSHFKQVNDSTFTINLQNGLAIYTSGRIDDLNKMHRVLMRSIQFISTRDTIYSNINSNNKFTFIPFKNNFGKFTLSTPEAGFGHKHFFEYQLKGDNLNWTRLNNEMEIILPSLQPGKYTLLIREVGLEHVSFEYNFEIGYPWYLKPVYLLMYMIVFFSILGYTRIYYRRKVRKEQEDTQRRERQKFELKNLESEKKLLVLKEENYRIELEKKNNELAASTMNNIRKNELLNELKTEIVNFAKAKDHSQIKNNARLLLKKINNHINSKEDWLTFELNFNNAHGNFFNRIREEFPNLSPTDLKLCAYLKLNLSSKEIASLMNISPRSVEMSRYRLRKKLNLDKDTSLNQFIGLY